MPRFTVHRVVTSDEPRSFPKAIKRTARSASQGKGVFIYEEQRNVIQEMV